jgi:hypothetical protein
LAALVAGAVHRKELVLAEVRVLVEQLILQLKRAVQVQQVRVLMAEQTPTTGEQVGEVELA